MASELSSDVFGYKRNAKPRGVFSTENSKLTFGAAGKGMTADSTDGGYLVQNWSINYQQNVQEVFEIGSNALYWSKGRPQGQGALGRIIGDKDAEASNTKNGHFFPEEAYDICQGGATLELSASGGACESGVVDADGNSVTLNSTLNITMSGCLVTNIGFQMQIGNVRLMENMGWRFAYMQFI